MDYYHDADLNAGRNLGQWDGFSCSLDLKKVASVMGSTDAENGLARHQPEVVILPQKWVT